MASVARGDTFSRKVLIIALAVFLALVVFAILLVVVFVVLAVPYQSIHHGGPLIVHRARP